MTAHQFRSPFSVASQLLQGKSLYRSLFNLTLKNYAIAGKVLDIGSKNNSSSYYSYFKVDSEAEIIYTDIQKADNVTYLDVEKPFPFPHEDVDVVLAFNLFEHIYQYELAPQEMFRILRIGGSLFVVVPFLHEYHADPDDYFRFTDSSLRRIWEDAGLECVHMEAIGEGLLTACATKLATLIVPRWGRSGIAALLYLITTTIDRLIALRPRIGGKTVPVRFALGYFAIFQKP